MLFFFLVHLFVWLMWLAINSDADFVAEKFVTLIRKWSLVSWLIVIYFEASFYFE